MKTFTLPVAGTFDAAHERCGRGGTPDALGRACLRYPPPARAGSVVSFDTVAVFVTLMLAGRLIERRLVWRHRRLLSEVDADVAALKERRLGADGVRLIAVRDLAVGDRVRLGMGELVPTDAVLDDERALSFSWLTGESDAHVVAAGGTVPASAHVADARGASVRVTRPFSATKLSSLLAPRDDGDVREGGGLVTSGLFPWLSKAWVVFAFSAAGLGAFLFRGAPTARLLEVTAALLVVTCPCALGIAAPLAIERATALLRRRGVFVRDPRLWWRAARVRAAVFDKTGTLTSEQPAVDEAGRAALRALSSDARNAAFAAARASNRARARAIDAAREALGASDRGVTASVVEQPGRGLTATVRSAASSFTVTFSRATDGARTAITVMNDAGTLECADVGVCEALRPGAAQAIADLAALSVTAYVASGHSEARAHAVAGAVGVAHDRVRGAMSPDDKAALVRALGGERVLAVGDGVNDAAMLAVAGVCGVPATDRPHLPARADFMLLGPSEVGAFGSVKDVLVVARTLRRALITLLSIATVYNVVVVGAGLLGLLTPLLVALLMPAMSASLLLMALWLVGLPVTGTPAETTPVVEAAHRKVVIA